MKKIIAALLVASAVLTPALASAASRHHYVPLQTGAFRGSSDAVSVGGQRIGQDPDPRIRSELIRDANLPNE